MHGTTNPGGPGPAGSQEWRLGAGEIALIFLFWTLLAALSTANRVLDPRGPGVQLVPPSAPVVLTLFESYVWAALTPVVFRLASLFSPGRTSWLWRVPLLLGVGIALAIGVHVVVAVGQSDVLGAPRRRVAGLLPGIRQFWFLNDFVIYLGVLATGFARDYSRRYRAGHEEAARLQTEAATLRARLAEAQVATLRSQLDPHFLFNTLNVISGMVERDPRGARRMIARLSDLLRATLAEGAAPENTVEREMDFVARYLEIMQVRFEGRLDVRIEVEPSAVHALAPALVLQPLVENAVKHGVGAVRGRARIDVEARRVGDTLKLSVRDNGPGPSVAGPSSPSAGLGLRNTEERLRQMYGDAQRLSIRRGEAGGTVAEVELPYRRAEAGHDRPALSVQAGRER